MTVPWHYRWYVKRSDIFVTGYITYSYGYSLCVTVHILRQSAVPGVYHLVIGNRRRNKKILFITKVMFILEPHYII